MFQKKKCWMMNWNEFELNESASRSASENSKFKIPVNLLNCIKVKVIWKKLRMTIKNRNKIFLVLIVGERIKSLSNVEGKNYIQPKYILLNFSITCRQIASNSGVWKPHRALIFMLTQGVFHIQGLAFSLFCLIFEVFSAAVLIIIQIPLPGCKMTFFLLSHQQEHMSKI